jgi:biopolymer transport protein ExbB/TolQ
VDRMQLVPFDKKAVIVLVVAALIPMIPLLGTVVGLTDIISMLGKFMV